MIGVVVGRMPIFANECAIDIQHNTEQHFAIISNWFQPSRPGRVLIKCIDSCTMRALTLNYTYTHSHIIKTKTDSTHCSSFIIYLGPYLGSFGFLALTSGTQNFFYLKVSSIGQIRNNNVQLVVILWCLCKVH